MYTQGAVILDRILRLSDTPTLDGGHGRQRQMTSWESMPILDCLIDRYPLAGTGDEDFTFGVGRLLCGFEHLLVEQDGGPAPAEG